MHSALKKLLALVGICCGVVATQAANPVRTAPPEVVVVQPMCRETEWWGQNKVNTHDGYLGNFISGCDSTAWGQILSYYGRQREFPANWTFTPISNWVYESLLNEETENPTDRTTVNLEKRTTGHLRTSDNRYGNNNPEGTRVSYTTGESSVPTWDSYTWSASKTVDADGNGTVDGKDHAGRLLWDLGVIGGITYGNGGLTTLFQKNSDAYDDLTQRNETALSRFFPLAGKGWRYSLINVETQHWQSLVEAILRGSLQVGAPIQVGVTGHAIVCDGFGYQDGVPYFHLNYGFCGEYNCWVPIEWFWCAVKNSYKADFYQMVTNVHPVDSGCVIAGVVMDAGAPRVGVEVTCGDKTTTTDEAGAYVFTNLTEEGTYTVTCGEESQTVTLGTFIDDTAREALQAKASDEKDNQGNERVIQIDVGHAVVDFGTKAAPTSPLKPYLLGHLSNFKMGASGSCSYVLNDNTVNDDGSVTIDSKPLVIENTQAVASNDPGLTVVLKYKDLVTNVSDRALLTISDTENNGRVGVYADRTGTSHGIWEQAAWADENNGEEKNVARTNTVADSGYLVLTYHTTDSSGTAAYDRAGNVVYRADGLKASGKKVGQKVCIGGLYTNDLIARGMVVQGVSLYSTTLSTAADIQQAIDDLAEYTETAPTFRFVPGTALMGWFSEWGGEADSGAAKKVIAPSGEVKDLHMVRNDGGKTWHPWVGSKDKPFKAKSSYTLVTYGCADGVRASAEGQYAVLWCMGTMDGEKTALVKDYAGNIQLVQGCGTDTPTKKINAGPLRGYHLFTVRVDATDGASLQIDAQQQKEDASMTTTPGDGFQIGSIHGGIDGKYEKGLGFIVCRMEGYGSASAPTKRQLAALCAECPAVTAISGLTYSGEEPLTIPSLSLMMDTLTVQQGTVSVAEVRVENGSALDLSAATVQGIGTSGSITVDVGTLRLTAGQTLTCPITVKATGTLDIVGLADIMTATEAVTILSTPGLTVEEGAKVTFDGKALPDYYTATFADGVFTLEVTGELPVATTAVLRLREIMPKGSETNLDPNGLESGWVEVENTSPDAWADLADYRFIRINRCKEVKSKGFGNFPTYLIPPGGRFVFYTSEMYPNGKGWVEDDEKVGLFGTKDADKKGKPYPKFYPNLNNILVWPDKVNPKKHPFVRLYHAPEDGEMTIVDTVVVPSDLPEDASILVGDATARQSTLRWICPTPTKRRENPATTSLTRLGPNVGPLYEFPWDDDLKKKYVESEFQYKGFTPMATAGQPYTITLPINPVMNPQGGEVRAPDTIESVTLIYRKGFGTATEKDPIVEGEPIEMTLGDVGNYNWGQLYTAKIPADFITEADKGKLIQWKVQITDKAGSTWTSPSFNNKDDGYEWYGTIVADETLESKGLPTWHMFADAASVTEMDKDNPKQDLSVVPHNARVAIYDSSTQTYYDYVRIDLRGQTSSTFAKLSHGLRFAKAHPMMMTDIVTGEELETEVRKSSLISEFADPSWMRQMVSFWLFREMGNKTPFDFPVRCNLNGAFYQLAFHSERFSDELLEDCYGLDKFGYGYKNAGARESGNNNTTEKKLPDDGDETSSAALAQLDAFRESLANAGADKANTTESTALTKIVVQKFDLPAWLNYIASSKITHETDDVWANLGLYYDSPTMMDDTERGTGTWTPLPYDHNLSFGQWYCNGDTSHGLMADEDWYKSHPFYGGMLIRAYNKEGSNTTAGAGNLMYEAIFQSPKFRRLYLRRLRTLMDAHLKEPNTAEADVPFMVTMRNLAVKMQADSELDYKKWHSTDAQKATDAKIDVWGEGNRPTTIADGIQDIWDNYVVPRQIHLYETHSVDNTTKSVGYAANLSAGIPAAQSAIADLAAGISATYDADLGAVVIQNTNAEVIDLSGWKLTGPVKMILPPGTVIDQCINASPGEVYVTADRRATIAALGDDVTDLVVVGNGTPGEGVVVLRTAAGETVSAPEPAILTEPDETAQEVVDGATSETGIPVVGEKVTGEQLNAMIDQGDDGETTITIGGLTVTVPKYYTVTPRHDGTGFTLTLNTPTIGEAKLDEDDETEAPALSMDADGNFVITVSVAYPRLRYRLQSCDTPGGTFRDVEGATARDKESAFQLKAAMGTAIKQFYRIIVED